MKKSISLTGIALLLPVSSLSAATHYVSLESTNPTPPYTNWATAATNIQDAVNVAGTNDVVLVTNGVYPGGVTITNPLALRSVNGPQVTVIDGRWANRCASLSAGASLRGFTLINGMAAYAVAGGVYCSSTSALLTNCGIVGNQGEGGGGAYGGTLYNCTLAGNTSWGYCQVGPYCPAPGGGALNSTLYNCTLTGNSATEGGRARCDSKVPTSRPSGGVSR